MSAVLIRERMTDYAAVLADVVAVLEAPRQQVTPADRRAITKLLDAMTDVNAMVNYHFNCRRLSAEHLAEIRTKVARLVPRSRA
jgi:anti-sigma-K factor RskA